MATSSAPGRKTSHGRPASSSSAATSTARSFVAASNPARSDEASMSQTLDAETLLQTRGAHRTLDAYVVGAAFERGGELAAFALGDGSLHFASLAEPKDDW